MQKINIKYCLSIIALLLLISVHVSCLNEEKLIKNCKRKAISKTKGLIWRSTDDILRQIDYTPGYRDYHDLFTNVIKLTGKLSRPWYKCTVNVCLDQLKEDRFYKIQPYDGKKYEELIKNVNLMRLNEYSITYLEIFRGIEQNDDMKNTNTEYILKYINHLREVYHISGIPMNESTYCLNRMCIEKIRDCGFNTDSGATNKTLLNSYFFKIQFDTCEGDLVRRYKREITESKPEDAQNLFCFCGKIICEMELKEMGFNLNDDWKKSLNHYKSKIKGRTSANFFSFVFLYGSYLERNKKELFELMNNDNENSTIIWGPAEFCKA